jgi:hypothetical protein
MLHFPGSRSRHRSLVICQPHVARARELRNPLGTVHLLGTHVEMGIRDKVPGYPVFGVEHPEDPGGVISGHAQTNFGPVLRGTGDLPGP